MKIETGRYTAGEVIKTAGLNVKAIGSTRVRIGGIRGINTPEHEVFLSVGECEVVVANETVVIEVTEVDEPVVSDGVKAVHEANRPEQETEEQE